VAVRGQFFGDSMSLYVEFLRQDCVCMNDITLSGPPRTPCLFFLASRRREQRILQLCWILVYCRKQEYLRRLDE